MATHARTSTPSIWQRAGALLLVLALLWAQALGLAHRVLHAGTAPATAVEMPRAADTGPLAHLLGGKVGDADCRLYDQLAHGDAVPLPLAPMLPAVPPLALAVVEPAFVFLSFCAPFAARAPPAIR